MMISGAAWWSVRIGGHVRPLDRSSITERANLDWWTKVAPETDVRGVPARRVALERTRGTIHWEADREPREGERKTGAFSDI